MNLREAGKGWRMISIENMDGLQWKRKWSGPIGNTGVHTHTWPHCLESSDMLT